MPKTKLIVVTGGVVSGIGKGVSAASIGKLLSPQHKVAVMKLDGYLNVDPGTMNPVEHGEVFVLDDGGEVDMDFGHYERFLDVTTKFHWNLTMGKVFNEIRIRERRGDYLGQTVQYIPHVVDFIKERIMQISEEEEADALIVEVGGTVGDIENELYIEACRQLKHDIGTENIMYVHLVYVPELQAVGEQKSKPTQQSVALLRQRGIQPDIIIGRSIAPLHDKIRKKISTFCDVSESAVFSCIDVDSVYKIPLLFDAEGMTDVIAQELNLSLTPNLEEWQTLLSKEPQAEINIAICGKYTDLEDSYASVVEALNHSACHHAVRLNVKWVETTDIKGEAHVEKALEGVQGVIVPGGFGSRGIEGKIHVIKYCREKKIPFLGLCYGMQLAVIEHARKLGMNDANSTEVNENTEHPVVDLLPEQREIEDKGATMRLGGHDIQVREGTKAADMFGASVRLRFRHRYEVNPEYVKAMETGGLVFSGATADGRIMQIMELTDHPFFMATQAHPELTSRLERPSPFFREFVKAIVVKKRIEQLKI